MNELLTPQAVRKYLNISRTTLWKMTSTGALPVVRLNKSGKTIMRFRQEDIQKFVNDRLENHE
ncbi:MAG: helix-turn-helix domain-containing protein [Rhabdochlamydiaceae bacterium]